MESLGQVEKAASRSITELVVSPDEFERLLLREHAAAIRSRSFAGGTGDATVIDCGMPS